MRDRVFFWVAIGLIATEIVVLADLVLGGAVYKSFGREKFTDIVYSRGAIIAALTLIPIGVALARRAKWSIFAPFVAIGLATVFLLSSESAMLVVVVSGTVYALVRWQRRLFWAILVLPVAFILVAPAPNLIKLDNGDLCTLKAVKPTIAHRIIIWQFVTENILQKPIAGWGMDSARSIPGGGDVVVIAKCANPSQGKIETYSGERLPLHPHNSALQIWLELGAIGAVIAALSIAHLLRRARRGGDSALIAAVFSSSFIAYSISFGIWQSWLIFTMIILLILTSLSKKPEISNAA